MSLPKRKVQVVIVHHEINKKQFNLLLLKTNKKRGEFWQNVTGGVDEGEKYKDAAYREVMEEISLPADKIEHFIELDRFKFISRNWGYEAQEQIYLLVTHHQWEVQLDQKEHIEFKWHNLFDFPHEVIKYKSNLNAIEQSVKRVNELYNL